MRGVSEVRRLLGVLSSSFLLEAGPQPYRSLRNHLQDRYPNLVAQVEGSGKKFNRELSYALQDLKEKEDLERIADPATGERVWAVGLEV